MAIYRDKYFSNFCLCIFIVKSLFEPNEIVSRQELL